MREDALPCRAPSRMSILVLTMLSSCSPRIACMTALPYSHAQDPFLCSSSLLSQHQAFCPGTSWKCGEALRHFRPYSSASWALNLPMRSFTYLATGM